MGSSENRQFNITPENTTLYHFDDTDWADHVFHMLSREKGVNIYRRHYPEIYEELALSGLYSVISMGKIEDNPEEIEHFVETIAEYEIGPIETLEDDESLLTEYAYMRLDGEIPLDE